MQKRYHVLNEPLTSKQTEEVAIDTLSDEFASVSSPARGSSSNIVDEIGKQAKVAGKLGLDAAHFATSSAFRGFIELKNAVEFLTTVRSVCGSQKPYAT
jgi:hypothetical protein